MRRQRRALRSSQTSFRAPAIGPSGWEDSMAELRKQEEVPTGLVESENLSLLRSLPDACVDLIYIDPPFGTGQIRRLQSIVTGAGEKSRIGFAGRNYRWQVRSDLSYA